VCRFSGLIDRCILLQTVAWVRAKLEEKEEEEEEDHQAHEPPWNLH